MNAHVVYLGMRPVTPTNVVLDKNTASIRQMCLASSEIRVLTAPEVPNSVGYPTVRDFIIAEAASGYKVAHIDQSMIILYNA